MSVNVCYRPFSARRETVEKAPNYPIVTASYHPPQTFGRKLSVNLDINVVDLHAHAIHCVDRQGSSVLRHSQSCPRRRGLGTMPHLRREPTRPKAASAPQAIDAYAPVTSAAPAQ